MKRGRITKSKEGPRIEPRSFSSRDVAILAALAVATVAVFRQIGGHAFINYDDPAYITENPHVRAGLTMEGILWSFTSFYKANWHPLTWVSHMLDWRLFGGDPGPHHLVSLLLHTTSALLLYLVLARMTRARAPSAAVAFLFALHPLHVESVAWSAERKDVLSGLFWVLTMGAYVLYTERPRARRYLAVVAFCALGLLAKPMLVSLPFALLLLDLWPLGRLDVSRSAIRRDLPPLVREKIPLFALSAVSCVLTVLAQKGYGAVVPFGVILPGARVSNAIVVAVGYIVKTIAPLSLAPYYPHPGGRAAWLVAGAAILLLAVTALAFRVVRTARYVAVGWLWYLGSLVPVIGIVQVGGQAMADRYTYLPLVGIFILVAWGSIGLASRVKNGGRVLAAAAIVLGPLLAAGAWTQAGYWRDSITLFTHTVEVTRENAFAHAILGAALDERGRGDEAVVHYREAVRIDPSDAITQTNLGVSLADRGLLDEAIEHYRAALRARPAYAAAHNDLGAALAARGQIDAAIEEYARAVEEDPVYAQARSNLAGALLYRGDAPGAAVHYRAVVRLNPDSIDARAGLGDALLRQGLSDEAIVQFEEVLRRTPGDPRATRSLAIARARQGQANSPGQGARMGVGRERGPGTGRERALEGSEAR